MPAPGPFRCSTGWSRTPRPTASCAAVPKGLLPAFIEAARELVAIGADGITTNCGFLSVYQEEIARAVGVPVATSSLMQAPMIQALLPPGRRVGILTISKATLTEAHLAAAARAGGHARLGHRWWPRIHARHPGRRAAARRRGRRGGSDRGRPGAGRGSSRCRRGAAGVHQHVPLRGRPRRAAGRAGLRHDELCALVPRAASGPIASGDQGRLADEKPQAAGSTSTSASGGKGLAWHGRRSRRWPADHFRCASARIRSGR